jgi:glucokinase
VTEIVAADIGGTHARFAIATVENGRVASLGEASTLKTTDHRDFESAWQAFAERIGRKLPPAAAIAVAASPQGAELKLTNNDWVIRPASFPTGLGIERHVLINDFGAVGHAVAQLGGNSFRHLFGPEDPLPQSGVISIVGPGTGLGAAQLLRREGLYDVVETEAGHIDFAPLDAIEDRILACLRERHRRVSVERLASGSGLANIHGALARSEGFSPASCDERALWAAALDASDALAAAALDRFCMILGSVAGDIALAQGAGAVVVAGGLGLRLRDHLPCSGFHDRFVAKGRFERRMREMPVKLVTHKQPGLYGAAAAFAREFSE